MQYLLTFLFTFHHSICEKYFQGNIMQKVICIVLFPGIHSLKSYLSYREKMLKRR